MNKRQQALLRLLLARTEEPLRIQELAAKLDCSEKTVRNDLKQLDGSLKPFPSAVITRKPGSGIRLSIGSDDYAELINHMYQTEKAGTSEHEQILILAHQLLISDKPKTLTVLSEKLYTNKMTVRNYLHMIAHWLEQYDLKLISKQRIGNHIEGSELNKRNALAHLTDLISTKVTEPKRDHMLQLFPAHEIGTVRKALKDLQHTFPVPLTQGETESLLIHALIMVQRTRNRSQLSLDYPEIKQGIDSEASRMTDWFLNRLQNALRISFPDSEHIYFTWHLQSCQHLNQSLNTSDKQQIEDIVQHLTTQMQIMAMTDFTQDNILSKGLFTHLESTLNRIRHGLVITNPMLTDIKQTYPYMFSMVVFSLEEVNKSYQLNIPEDEAAYLVLHFQAAIERMRKDTTAMKRAVIVCELGIGMSHLLQAKLEQTYQNIDIQACLNKAETKTYLAENNVDFVIATTDLPDTGIPVIQISPLLKEKDKRQLNKFLQSMVAETISVEQSLKHVGQLLDEKTIYLDVNLDHRFEIVELLAGNLFQQGYVKKTFIHSSLAREKSASTEIGGGIAIPHANPDSVKRSVISIAILKDPIEWGEQLVSVVFLLAVSAADQDKARPLMQTIASISQQPDIIQQLKQAENSSDVVAIFRK
ncbi:BglG family transcription antiterminator [Virgibacillus siamensis]|uniref:BglG family transcription antiterminator n=1 Tax=Virgibacillus siamensis TaxID=480071 RepID=UPI000987593D|nr:BglG family transcription antiterminator [Virgibacillus siamensis]